MVKSGHPCLIPDTGIRGKASNLSPLSMMLAVGLSFVTFTMYVPFISNLSYLNHFFLASPAKDCQFYLFKKTAISFIDMFYHFFSLCFIYFRSDLCYFLSSDYFGLSLFLIVP